jgi:hypothetical protein
MRLVYPSFQKTKSGAEACRSKYDSQTFAKCYNVDVESYHADSGAFRTIIFPKEIDNKHQKLSYSGVNVQWQNGLVERSNRTLRVIA